MSRLTYAFLFLAVLLIPMQMGCNGKKGGEKKDKSQSSRLETVVTPVAEFTPAAQESEGGLLLIAPEKPIVFALWKGGEVDPNSSNPVQKMVADPLFREPFEKAFGGFSLLPYIAIGSNVNLADPENEGQEFILAKAIGASGKVRQALIESPGAAFFDMDMAQQKIDAAFVLQTGESTDMVIATINAMQQPYGKLEPAAKIQGVDFFLLPLPDMPVEGILYASVDGFALFALGEESAAGVLKRLGGNSVPEWLGTAMENSKWVELTEYFRVDVERAFDQAGGLPPELAGLGLNEIESFELVTGHSQHGVVTRATVVGGQELAGMANMQAVDFGAYKHIPADASIAMVAGVNPEDAWDGFMKQIQITSPWEHRNFVQFEEGMEREIGINLRKDVLANLGSNLSVHTSLSDDLLGGIVFSVDIKNPAAIQGLFDKLIDMARKSQQQGEYYGPSILIQKMGEHVVGSMAPEDFVVEPTWCIAGNRLYFSMSPEAMRSTLAGNSEQALFDGELKNRFGRLGGPVAGDKLLGAGYVDTGEVLKLVYPFIRGGLSAFKGYSKYEFGGDDLVEQQMRLVVGNLELPPLRTLLRHVGPMIYTSRLTDNGFETELHHTLPVTRPFAGVLPSFLVLFGTRGVEMAIERPALDVRQVGLSFHNFESAFGHFPNDIIDAEGKPLLSWRVAILPFIGQQNLFDQFRQNEPWDSAHNKKLLSRMPELYRVDGDEEGVKTVYRGIGGAGLFGDGKGKIGFRDITDGSSNTAMIVKTSPELATEWTKPGTLDCETVDIVQLIGKRNAMLTVFADGSVQYVPRDLGEANIRQLFTRAGGEIVDFESADEEGVFEGDEEGVSEFEQAIIDANKAIYGDSELIMGESWYSRKARAYSHGDGRAHAHDHWEERARDAVEAVEVERIVKEAVGEAEAVGEKAKEAPRN